MAWHVWVYILVHHHHQIDWWATAHMHTHNSLLLSVSMVSFCSDGRFLLRSHLKIVRTCHISCFLCQPNRNNNNNNYIVSESIVFQLWIAPHLGAMVVQHHRMGQPSRYHALHTHTLHTVTRYASISIPVVYNIAIFTFILQSASFQYWIRIFIFYTKYIYNIYTIN